MGAGKDGHLTDHVRRANHVLGSRCSSIEETGPVPVRLSLSVGGLAATPAGLRGSFKSQPRQG